MAKVICGTRGILTLILMAVPVLLSGCKTTFINVEPLRELHPSAAPVGNMYAGWRVFQDKCSSCHGMAATGSERAPDLLLAVRDMAPRQFIALVLKRYDLGTGVIQGSQDQSTIDTRIDDIMRRGETPIEMPGWQSEPAVNAHILDLYAYLSARAEGQLSAGRPPQ